MKHTFITVTTKRMAGTVNDAAVNVSNINAIVDKGDFRVIHFNGGEPFAVWDTMNDLFAKMSEVK